MVIKDYVKEYIRITLSSIKNPESFFRAIPDKEKDSAKPAVYLILSLAVGLLFNPIILSQIFRPIYSVNDLFIYFIILLILFIIIAVILIPSLLYIFLMHFVIRLVGGKGKIEDTFMVLCYSVSPLNFFWILNFLTAFPGAYGYYFRPWILFSVFLLLIGGILYTLYIMITGISVRSGITKPRAFAAAFVPPLLITLFFLVIFMPIQQSYNPGIEYPVPQEVPYVSIEPLQPRYNLTAYLGSAPVIDGMINENDRWNEGTRIPVYVRMKNYTITLKHDREFLYILLELESPVQWRDNITIYLEQDEGSPDFDMNTGRIQRYYQILNIETTELVDTYYDSGSFVLSEHQDGSLKVNYFDGWIMEWKIPLNSGDKHDIHVDKYPTRLGFSMISEMRNEGGILPPSADFSAYISSYTNYPQKWSDLEIVATKKP